MESPSAPGAVLGNGAAGADMVTSSKGPHTTHMGAELKGAQSLPEEATLNLSPAGGGEGKVGRERSCRWREQQRAASLRLGQELSVKARLLLQENAAWLCPPSGGLWTWGKYYGIGC